MTRDWAGQGEEQSGQGEGANGGPEKENHELNALAAMETFAIGSEEERAAERGEQVGHILVLVRARRLLPLVGL